MLKIRKTKWIAGLLALALTGGMAAVTTACGGEGSAAVRDEEEEQDREEKQDQEVTGEADKNPQGTEGEKQEETGAGPEGTEQPSAENGEQDCSGLAARIEEAAMAYLEALKTGDIAVVLSVTDPDSKVYKKLSGIQDYETGKEFIRTLYGGLIYQWEEDRSTEYNVERGMKRERAGDSSFYLDLYIGAPDMLTFRHCLDMPGVAFQDGELIPDGYEVASDEEALQMVRSVMELVPLVDASIKVELQEDGTFYFDMTGPFFVLDDIDVDDGESFLTEFMTELISDGTVIGTSDGQTKGYPEECAEILSLLKQQDLGGLLALANGNPEKYIKEVFSQRTLYRTPEELTDAQRAFYDNYMEQVRVYISQVTYPKSQVLDVAVIIVAPAVSIDDEEMAWYTENGIKENTIVLNLGRNDGDNSLLGALSDLLSPVEDAIEYAEREY